MSNLPDHCGSKLPEDVVRKVADLANLTLTDSEVEQMQVDLAGVLDLMKTLDDIDTDGVEPMTHVFGDESMLREDVVRSSLSNDEAVANAPATSDGYFKVPRVLP